MQRFWIEVTVKCRGCKSEPTISAFYATSIGEALDYAYDHLCSPYFGSIVRIFDTDMNPLFTTEFDFWKGQGYPRVTLCRLELWRFCQDENSRLIPFKLCYYVIAGLIEQYSEQQLEQVHEDSVPRKLAKVNS